MYSLLTLLLACRPGEKDSDTAPASVAPDTAEPAVDADGDGWTPEGGDCDDADAAVYPGQVEDCDGADDDCDGAADEGLDDADADGTADCLDAEECDGLDNDGDGLADEGFSDADDDGAADCADSEACDGLDNDGDGAADDPYDLDGDGHSPCAPDPDCDDADPGAFPGNDEAAGDGADNDCDGMIDEGEWGEGDLVVTEVLANPGAVSDPLGEWIEVYNASNREVYLNGLVLASDSGERVLDGPPLALAPGELAVLGREGDASLNGGVAVGGVYGELYLSNESDTLTLRIDGVVLDVVSWDDGATMPDAEGASLAVDPLGWDDALNDSAGWWCEAELPWAGGDAGSPGALNPGCPAFDHDGDGYSPAGGDCDDAAAGVHPAAAEIWYDGIDQNCAEDDDFDADADGWAAGGDCDDAAAAVYPGAAELCDGLDGDCDGQVDEDAVDAAAWYGDADGDGYGDEADAVWACGASAGRVAVSGDCDPADAATHPAAAEACGDGLDNDCDGVSTFCEEVPWPVGGQAYSWDKAAYYRGNIYQADDETSLLRYEVYLGLAEACDLDYYVFSAEDLAGPWTLEWAAMSAAEGSGYHSSGDVMLAVEPGRYYSLGVGWSCEATYYADYGSFSGVDGGVGLFSGNHYDNSYAGYSAAYTPPLTGAGVFAYDQVVYTED